MRKGRIWTLPPERRSPTRQVPETAWKHAGSENRRSVWLVESGAVWASDFGSDPGFPVSGFVISVRDAASSVWHHETPFPAKNPRKPMTRYEFKANSGRHHRQPRFLPRPARHRGARRNPPAFQATRHQGRPARREGLQARRRRDPRRRPQVRRPVPASTATRSTACSSACRTSATKRAWPTRSSSPASTCPC